MGVHSGESVKTAAYPRFVARLKSSGMMRQSALVFTASMVLSVGGFAFHAIASRRLGVAEYGTLYALISAFTLATLPAGLLAPVIVRFAAEFRALHDDRHIRGLTLSLARGFGAIGFVYIAIASIFAQPIAHFLHVPAWTIPIVGVLAAIGLASGAGRSVVQGTQSFGTYSGSIVAEGVMKVVGLVAFTALGWNLIGGILGFMVGSVCGLGFVGWRLLRHYRRVQPAKVSYDWRRIAGASGASAAIAIAGAFIGSADVVLVKHFFDPALAGIYSAASLVGKIPLYFVGFIPTVLLPHATDRHARGERTRGVLAVSLGMFAVFSVGSLIVFKFFGIVVLHALVGRKFDAALGLLVPYSAAMVLLALMSALASYGIATHRLAFALPLVLGAAATLGTIALVHPSLTVVVGILVIGNAITALVMAAVLGIQGLRDDRAKVRA
ncbi:MAG: MATE family efflux transporter [Vulcanimicrobiaceae bacterium]